MVGMAAIFASLVFVGLQIRQDQSIALAESYGVNAGTASQLAELMEGRGELWRKGLDGEELTQAERIEFDALAYAVESAFMMDWNREVQLGATNPDSTLRDYAIAVHSHAGLRRYFQSRIARINQTDAAFGVSVEFGPFTTATAKLLEYLTANSRPVLETKEYVFWN